MEEFEYVSEPLAVVNGFFERETRVGNLAASGRIRTFKCAREAVESTLMETSVASFERLIRQVRDKAAGILQSLEHILKDTQLLPEDSSEFSAASKLRDAVAAYLGFEEKSSAKKSVAAVCDLKLKISKWLKNHPETFSPVDFKWYKAAGRLVEVSFMSMALDIMLEGFQVYNEDKAPYQSIYSTEVEVFGTSFKEAMGEEVLKCFQDSCLEEGGQSKDLWSEIKRILEEYDPSHTADDLFEGYEGYVYDPTIDTDPLVSSLNAKSALHAFFYHKETDTLFAMEFFTRMFVDTDAFKKEVEERHIRFESDNEEEEKREKKREKLEATPTIWE